MKKFRSYLIAIIIFIIVALVLQSGYFTAGKLIQGWDSSFHSYIISSYRLSIMNGDFFPKGILPSLGFNLGYGTPLFYPTFFHYCTAILSLFLFPFGTHSVAIAMLIINFLNFVLSGLFIYILSTKLFKSRLVAILSGIVYMIIPFHVSQIITRGSFSESWLFIFLPILCLGMYYLIKQKYHLAIINVVIGLLGGFYSHPMTFLVCLILLLPLTLAYYKQIFTKRSLIALLIGIVVFLCLSAPAWLNLLYLKTHCDYLVFRGGEIMQTYEGFASSFKTLKSYFEYPTNPYSVFNTSMNLIIWFMCGCSIVFTCCSKQKWFKKIVIVISLATIIYLCITSKLFATEFVIKSLVGLQFIDRLYILPCLGISLLAPVFLLGLQKKVIVSILFGIVLIFSSLNNIVFAWEQDAQHSLSFLKYPKELISQFGGFPENSSQALGTFGLQHEYLDAEKYPLGSAIPAWLLGRSQQGIICPQNECSINYLDTSKDQLEFTINSPSKYVDVEFPRLYYPGYQLININNGEVIKPTASTQGLVSANVLANNQSYKLIFVGNDWARIGYVVQSTTLIIILIGSGYMLVKKERQNNSGQE